MTWSSGGVLTPTLKLIYSQAELHVANNCAALWLKFCAGLTTVVAIMSEVVILPMRIIVIILWSLLITHFLEEHLQLIMTFLLLYNCYNSIYTHYQIIHISYVSSTKLLHNSHYSVIEIHWHIQLANSCGWLTICA